MRKVPAYPSPTQDGIDAVESAQDLRVRLTLAIARLRVTIKQTQTLLVDMADGNTVAILRTRSGLR